MPIYEYKCESCGEQFEKMTSMAKADDTPCQGCGSDETHRLLSVFGVGSTQPSMPACAAGPCSMDAASPCANGMCGPMMG